MEPRVWDHVRSRPGFASLGLLPEPYSSGYPRPPRIASTIAGGVAAESSRFASPKSEIFTHMPQSIQHVVRLQVAMGVVRVGRRRAARLREQC